VHFDYVRVIDAAHDLTLFQKHRAEIGVTREFRQHGFHRHEPLSTTHGRSLASDPHAGHATASESREQLVVTECVARLEFGAHECVAAAVVPTGPGTGSVFRIRFNLCHEIPA